MAGLLHLAKRFFWAVKPGPPSTEDESWANAQLLEGERQVWAKMNNPDRRHAVEVARAAVSEFTALGSEHASARPVIAAALLHDSGKILSGMRTPSRVFATVFWAVTDDTVADRWLDQPVGGPRRRLAQYRRHPELGADMLREAGSVDLTYQWAADHHRPEDRWSVQHDIGRVLKDCDDD